MAIGFFDLETLKLFKEIGGRYPLEIQTPKLGLSIAGLVVDEQPIKFFEDKDVENLIEILKGLDIIAGHNLIEFDYLVLKPYTRFDMTILHPKTVDTLMATKDKTGIFIGLDHLVKVTFGLEKTEDHMKIPSMWNSGNEDERKKVKNYLKSDIELTKRLYLHGKKGLPIRYEKNGEIKEFVADW